MIIKNILIIGCGGFIGASLRYIIVSIMNNYVKTFPLGTMIVNIIGSFLMGYFVKVILKDNSNQIIYLFLCVGVLGSFTTFSAYSYDIMNLINQTKYLLAGIYMLGSLILSVIFVYLGMRL